jgi:hypothetical protein
MTEANKLPVVVTCGASSAKTWFVTWRKRVFSFIERNDEARR